MQDRFQSIDDALAVAAKFHNAGDLAKAEVIYRQILQSNPKNTAALHNMGELAYRSRRFEVAVDLLRRCIELDPHNANHLNTFSVALMAVGRADDSFQVCRRVLELDPNFSNARSNLAICHVDRGEINEALAEFRKAIELDPNNACAHDGLGLTLLMTGDLQGGWQEQEWRWRKHDFPAHRYPNAPHWRGEDLNGKTLALYMEQGYGDVFNFCRYVPLLAVRGAKVFIEEVPELGGMLQRSLPGLTGLFPPNHPPVYDYLCSLMSVPLWFGTTLETIPTQEKYLQADPARVEQWRGFFATDPSLKVGIAWAGRPTHNNDLNRSTTLATFGPLAQLPGITFYSLQKGPQAAQAAAPPEGMRIIDLSHRLDNFETTAAVISHLDLVLGVDTVVVHLAAALGKPAWTILPFCPDWRWLLNRSDSPWYPTMRLFRLPRRGDWRAAIIQVAMALGEVLKKKIGK
jgi:tetratricopeptide (TPR) repeat protein